MSVRSDLVFLAHLVYAKLGLKTQPPPVTILEVRSAGLTSEPSRLCPVVLANDLFKPMEAGTDGVLRLRASSCVVQGPWDSRTAHASLVFGPLDLCAHQLQAILSILSLQLASGAPRRVSHMRAAVRRSRVGHSQLRKPRHAPHPWRLWYLHALKRDSSSRSPFRVKAPSHVSRALLQIATAPVLQMSDSMRHSCKNFTKLPCWQRPGRLRLYRLVSGRRRIDRLHDRLLSFGAQALSGFGKRLRKEPCWHIQRIGSLHWLRKPPRVQRVSLRRLTRVSRAQSEHRATPVKSLACKPLQTAAGRGARSLRSASQHAWDGSSVPLPACSRGAGMTCIPQEASNCRRLSSQAHWGGCLQWLRLCKSSSVQLLSCRFKHRKLRSKATWLRASCAPGQPKGCVHRKSGRVLAALEPPVGLSLSASGKIWKRLLRAAKLGRSAARRHRVCRRATGMLLSLIRKRFSLQMPCLSFSCSFVARAPDMYLAQWLFLPISSQKASCSGPCGSQILPLPASKQSSAPEWIAFAQRRLLQYQHVVLQILSPSLQSSLRCKIMLMCSAGAQRVARKPPERRSDLIGRHDSRSWLLPLNRFCFLGRSRSGTFHSRQAAHRRSCQSPLLHRCTIRQLQGHLQYLSKLLHLLSSFRLVRLHRTSPPKAQVCEASGTAIQRALSLSSSSAPKLRLVDLRRAPQSQCAYPVLLGHGRSGKLLSTSESESRPFEPPCKDVQMSFKATNARKVKR